jgi:PTS system ascorbate-specific IIA component
MSVGVLLITHNNIGDELLKTAITTFSGCPLAARVLHIASSIIDPETMLAQARTLVNELDTGAGVLVLTDIYGSTPSNIATRLLNDDAVIVVTGISLPMLLRVLNYPHLALSELADKAVSGGYEGIVILNESNRSIAGC